MHVFYVPLHQFLDGFGMRKFIAFIFICCVLFSCNARKKTEIETNEFLVEQDSLCEDSTEAVEQWEEDIEEHGRNDENFNDFFYSFTTYEKFQRNRVSFPLPMNEKDTEIVVERKAWKFLPLHSADDVYTVVFSHLNDMEIENEPSLDSVMVSRLEFMEETMTCYDFMKDKGHWYLVRMKRMPLAESTDAPFMTFFHQFAADSLFQYNHIASMVQFVTSDTENEFEQISGILEKSQWFVFRPDLPKEDLFTINYGQPLQDDKFRLLTLQGRSNSYICMLFFKKTHEGWMLYRFEN